MRLCFRFWPWKRCLWNIRNSIIILIIIIIIIIITITVLLITLRHPYPSINVMTVNKINKTVRVCCLQKYQWLIALLFWRFPWLGPFVVLVRVVWRCRWLTGLLECYCRGTTEVIEENPVPVPLCPPKVSHGLACNRVQSSALRVRRLTASALAWNFKD